MREVAGGTDAGGAAGLPGYVYHPSLGAVECWAGGRKVALQQSVYDRRLERRKGAAGGD